MLLVDWLPIRYIFKIQQQVGIVYVYSKTLKAKHLHFDSENQNTTVRASKFKANLVPRNWKLN